MDGPAPSTTRRRGEPAFRRQIAVGDGSYTDGRYSPPRRTGRYNPCGARPQSAGMTGWTPVPQRWRDRLQTGPTGLFFFLFLRLELGHDLLLDVRRHDVVMAQLHHVAALAAGDALELRGVARDLR